MTSDSSAPASTSSAGRPKRGCLATASSFVDGGLQSCFYRLGLWVGKAPWLTIALSVIVTGMCIAGVLQYRVESDGENLWVPQNSIELEQIRSVRDVFPKSPRSSTLYFLPKASDPAAGAGALTWPVVLDMFDVEELINGTRGAVAADGSAAVTTFEQLCEKVDVPVFGAMGRPTGTREQCVIGGITDLWGGNKTLALEDQAAGTSVVDKLNTALRTSAGGQLFSSRTFRPVVFNTTFGGVRFTGGGNVTGAAVLVLSFQLENNEARDTRSGTDVDPAAEDWELKAAERLIVDPAAQTFPASTVYFGIPASDSELRASAILGDLAFVGASIMMIVVFLAFQIRVDCTVVGLRIGLAMAGVLTVGLALGFAYGLGSLMAPYTNVHSVLPFVLAGIGVDDLFVITNEFSLTDRRTPRHVRLAQALKHAGPSITVTTLTDFAAFMIGSTTVLPALSAFSQWAAVAIVGVYLLACTFFSAAVVLDADRQAARRADCCCCFLRCDAETKGAENPVAGGAAAAAAKDGAAAPAGEAHDSKATAGDAEGGTAAATTAADATASPSDVDVKPSSADAPAAAAGTCCDETATRRCISGVYAPFILHPISRAVALVAFVAFAAVSIWAAAVGTNQEFREEWFVPGESPLQNVFSTRTTYFSENGLPVSGYAVNFTLADHRGLLLDVEHAMTNNTYINTEIGVTSWYRSFLASNASLRALPAADFHRAARDWLALSQNARFNGSVVWGAADGYVRATRLGAFYKAFSDADTEVRAMQTLQAAVTGAGTAAGLPADKVFASSFVFANWVQFVVIPGEAVQNLLFAVAACFVIVLVFIAHPLTALITTATVGLVLVDIMGVFTWWDISLNSVSVINLTLAVGLSVDYSAHIAHAFMHKHGTRTERATLALSEMGVSVVNGGFSTFLAVAVLSLSRSYIFVIFFKVFFLSVLFGMAHGLVFLPIVLSLIGPDPHDEFEEPPGGEAAPSASKRVATRAAAIADRGEVTADAALQSRSVAAAK